MKSIYDAEHITTLRKAYGKTDEVFGKVPGKTRLWGHKPQLWDKSESTASCCRWTLEEWWACSNHLCSYITQWFFNHVSAFYCRLGRIKMIFLDRGCGFCQLQYLNISGVRKTRNNTRHASGLTCYNIINVWNWECEMTLAYNSQKFSFLKRKNNLEFSVFPTHERLPHKTSQALFWPRSRWSCINQLNWDFLMLWILFSQPLEVVLMLGGDVHPTCPCNPQLQPLWYVPGLW